MENLISSRGHAESEYQNDEEQNEEVVYGKKMNAPPKHIDLSRLDNLEEISFASIKSLIKKK